MLSLSVSIGVSSAILFQQRALKLSSSVLNEHCLMFGLGKIHVDKCFQEHKNSDDAGWASSKLDPDFWITIKHLLLLVGVHVVQVLAVLLRDHLETSGLHVVHSDK